MLQGRAVHGHGEKALELFPRMPQEESPVLLFLSLLLLLFLPKIHIMSKRIKFSYFALNWIVLVRGSSSATICCVSRCE